MTQHSLSLPTLALATLTLAGSRRGRPAGRPCSGATAPTTAGSGSRSRRPGSTACRPAPRARRCARTWPSTPRPMRPRRRASAPASAASRATGRPISASASRWRGPARLFDSDRRRHAALARRGGAQGRPVERRAQQALRGRTRRQSRATGWWRASASASARPCARREGGRRALWRGLRLAQPRLRDQRQGAGHDARRPTPRAAPARISTTPPSIRTMAACWWRRRTRASPRCSWATTTARWRKT